MQLRDYLDSHKISPASFAEQINVSGAALYRYMSGDRIPRKPVMEKIIEKTGGLVRSDDFYSQFKEASN